MWQSQGVGANPLESLLVYGKPAKLHRSTEQAAAVHRGDGLIPWNGNAGGRGGGCLWVGCWLRGKEW